MNREGLNGCLGLPGFGEGCERIPIVLVEVAGGSWCWVSCLCSRVEVVRLAIDPPRNRAQKPRHNREYSSQRHPGVMVLVWVQGADQLAA
jgi:hypothetical protein